MNYLNYESLYKTKKCDNKILQQRSPNHEHKRPLQSLGQIYRLLQWIKNPFRNRITEMQNSEQQQN